ncbi:hypothetical protein BOTBODRAFT_114193 [Botryobasidium botryosum FD-172 SS1]|uniref:GRIP domain-containing protein n=1 Tax=Botryobasidium botryosum (strain FD-172 SS1) TaxID=930990 RepID=A0A067M742_BOTB1|nr:hypothetical protein BOTBODRAFT_114193 [Botryobasidium botryosum FD-172 SS1]
MEELRDTHRLESRSQSDQIDKLRSQFAETEALLAAATASVARVEEESAKHKAETETLKTEVERAKAVGKEEEEKRVKAISLLKTVRTKLVKAEKDRDEAARERDAAKEEGVRERERGLAEKARLEGEVERARAERDKEVAALKAQFEKELAEVRDKFEKESAARKSQFELDAITSKAAYTKELNAKTARIAQLEASVRNMSQEKDSMFDQLQMRQAELESSQSHLESLQNQTMELQYQLREAADRTAVLSDELSEAQRQAETNGGLGGGVSHAEVARLISDAESKYEARLAELRTKIRVLERERVEAEEEWSKGLHSRSKEVERLRRELKEKEGEWKEEMRSAERRDEKVRELERALVRKDEEKERDRAERDSIRADLERAKEAEAAARQEREESESRISLLERQLEELKTRDVQLRANNKASIILLYHTIRDELRKLQSSAALLERQRNPGVGFWSNTSRANVSNPSSPPPDGPGVFSSPTSPRPSSPALSEQAGSIRHEEEVNLEYLRNVIMQFLEHKEMRPNLVRVLSVILRFTPQETRRLAAKV